MASEPSSAADSADADAVPTQLLSERLQARLEHHLQVHGFAPALSVVGFDAAGSYLLAQGADRPEDAIMGFDLPSRYSAIGVLAASVVATSPQRQHEDAALALAVSRRGEVVSLLATADEVRTTHKPQGWLIDACRRTVGLETEPCQAAALSLPIALWFDRLMVAILNAPAGDPVLWRDAVDLCPIPPRWRSLNAVDLGTTLGSTTRSWQALRKAAAQGLRSPVAISAKWAAWMDDAMFARWCLGSFPDIANLRADVEFLAPSDVAEQVEIALRAAWLAFAD